jgi:lysine 2,3-aminomutase
MELVEPVTLEPSAQPPGDFAEPDWRRLPGFREVTGREWESSTWQLAHSVKNVRQLKDVFGSYLPDELAGDIERDQEVYATMPLLVPPHMLNTMDERNLRDDPVRRYMLPAHSDRASEWPTHPRAERDSLHERDMWAVEGLTHRYPNKVLVELLATCPQYCGHCTRMDLVGHSTAQFVKYRFAVRERERRQAILDHIRSSTEIRDVLVSGGDLANVPIVRLEEFVAELLDMPHVRDIRLASKSLVALPQHFLQRDVLEGLGRLAKKARARGVGLALHTHANHARQITPLVARAANSLLDLGFRDVRNQAVLLRGVNATRDDQLDLCLALLDRASITPYYAYLCDMVPNAEHWRTALWEAQEIQAGIMGHLPGYATPRLVCDVPFLGKLWVHQVAEYDRELGISRWRANDWAAEHAPDGFAEYYDPIHTLPESGQEWWRAATARASGQGIDR